MPTIWVPPEVYLEHKDFVVYHIYKDDDMDNGIQRENWFTLQATGSDSDGCCAENGTFDIRDLPEEVPEGYLPDEQDDAARTIKYHIDHGYFDDWEHDKPATLLERASTPEAKAACLERIIEVWKTTKSNSQAALQIEAELQVYLN